VIGKVTARLRPRRPRVRPALLVSLAIALIAAFLSVNKVSLSSPHLQSRNLVIGTAETTLLVDDPHSGATDLQASMDQFTSLQNRAALIGNLMTTDPVKVIIARIAGLSPSQINADAPITANVPQTLIEPGSGAAASDILANADHYKLQLQVDPTVPILHIYTQGPSAGAALTLASAAVSGLHQYLHQLAVSQRLDPASQVKLEQLGVPHGGVVNSGAPTEIALLTFVTMFVVAWFAIKALGRVRVGWRHAGQTLSASR
jgi:hypothetical protein